MSPVTVKITIVSIVMFAVAAAGFAFMYLQTQQQGEELTLQLATLAEQRSQEESYFRLRRVAEESAQEREQLSGYFFTSESQSIDFLNMVESLAPNAGVKLQTTSLNLVNDEDTGKQWIEIGFLFEGSRTRVEDFLAILEELPYVSKITMMDMSAVDQTRWQARVTMRVRVLNYDE